MNALQHRLQSVVGFFENLFAFDEIPGKQRFSSFCPSCGAQTLRRSRRRTVQDHVRSVVGLLAFRCENCDLRFYQRPGSAAPAAGEKLPDRSSFQPALTMALGALAIITLVLALGVAVVAVE